LLTCLVTRFSLPHPVWDGRTPEEYAGWLEERLELLQRFTVPSVRNLRVKPDRWYLLVGDHPAPFLGRLQEAANSTKVETVLLPHKGRGSAKMVADDLAGRHELPVDVCTVRLDSDDMIAARYFERLRDVLDGLENPGTGVGFSFPGGAAYSVASDEFHVVSYPDNPFLALAERVTRWSEFRGVYARMHTELLANTEKALYAHSGFPMWCSVVHDRHLANASLLRRYPLRFADAGKLRKTFGIG
jgi:hypothetical protein